VTNQPVTSKSRWRRLSGRFSDFYGVEVGMAGQPGLFDADARLCPLSAAGDPLEAQIGARFRAVRPELEVALDRADGSRGGRSSRYTSAFDQRGPLMRTGTLVDATLIPSASSTR